MAKAKSVFVCSECGYESNGWLGKCPACLQWNTFFEQKIDTIKSKNTMSQYSSKEYAVKPVSMEEIDTQGETRTLSGMKELDNVLGGGIVKGSLILVGGDPGIGKSTLIMQVGSECANHSKVLYISGEESASQIKQRAKRLNILSRQNSASLLLFSETCFDLIEETICEMDPQFIIVDSIQTIFVNGIDSQAGSVSQVKEVTARLMRIAKTRAVTVFIVGHVTKDGAIAGPRVLEHMVDTVLYFEGERHMSYRLLRAVKNRFGSTNEVGIFEMTSQGLTVVDNPSEMFLDGRQDGASGTAVVSCLEGTRPILTEIQALLTPTVFGAPRRNARGTDYNRMTMLLAVLEKKAGLSVGSCDAYVNVVGGMAIDEPASDLGVMMAVASSYKNKPIDHKTVLIGEVGLTGEVRAVGSIEKRINEAKKLGFLRCIIPAGNMKQIKSIHNLDGMNINEAANIDQVLNLLF